MSSADEPILTDWSRRWGLDDIEQFLDPTPEPPQPAARRSVPYIGPERPGDAFNARHTGSDILGRLGFTLARRDRSGDEHWVRPGKERREGSSATVYGDDGHTTIWSDTAAHMWPALDTRRPYDPFGLYAATSHAGDFTAARTELGRQGYGEPFQPDDLSWIELREFTPEPAPTEAVLAEGTASADPWPDPEPLEPELHHGPPFPVDVLPAWMADMATEVAEALLVPVDLPAVCALGALSTVAMTKVTAQVTGTTWTEDTNLYLMCAFPSGGGKSPAFTAAMKPVEDFEEARIRELSPLVDEATTRLDIATKKAKDARESAARGSMSTEDAVAVQADASEIVVPPSPAFIAEDATPEALGQHIAECGGIGAILSAEGDVVDMMGGQYAERGKGANLGVYLKSWDGESIRVKRVGRGVVRLPKSTLTICVTPQPVLVRRLGENAELGERGITARFLYSVPATNIGDRNYEALLRPAGAAIRQRYEDTLGELAGRLARCAYPMTLRTTEAATGEWVRWLNWTEARLRPGADLDGMAGWVAKLRGQTLRIAALLHLADGRGQDEALDEATFDRAFRLADYWIAHAKAVHAVWRVGSNPTRQRARKIIEWVVREGIEEFSARDLQLKQRRTFEAIEDTVEPLTWLVNGGWIDARSGLPVRVGQRGKPSPVFVVRPDAADWFEGRRTHGAQLTHGAQPVDGHEGDTGEGARHVHMRAVSPPHARPSITRFSDIHTYNYKQLEDSEPPTDTDGALRACAHGAHLDDSAETETPPESTPPSVTTPEPAPVSAEDTSSTPDPATEADDDDDDGAIW